MEQRKTLQDLTLLDRFLFAEAMEDPETMQSVLEIILGKDIVLKELPQAEKEVRKSPLYRWVRLDVWCKDDEDTVYDTEVQNRDTHNLPKRSRYYQGLIDGKQLEPGTIDFNKLNPLYIIIICPFDIFGYGKYKYTFNMQCKEVAGLDLNDESTRIFLNTHGTNEDEVSPELIELLHYMEFTNETQEQPIQSKKIRDMKKKVDNIKQNSEVGVRFMQAWEERELDRLEAMAQGRQEGIKEGINALITTCRKLQVNDDDIVEQIVSSLEIDEEQARKYLLDYNEIKK